ncbi:aspartate--ammonia ligase [Clostridiaceae bacterium OttesenSCG-928-D20]|nr:aspartate--ammonia ligase [Clostridiaceae bacterium OttesenSCG-928-D20]
MKTIIPKEYESYLGIYDTQKAIGLIHRIFEDNLAAALNLNRVSAPLFVDGSTGLNDNLSGTERPVTFDIPSIGGDGEIVHSLAKWKRLALKNYDYRIGKGIYTIMNAIRRDEQLDNLHSIYVDQWDWEKVIGEEDRNLGYLKSTVTAIVNAICDVSDTMRALYPRLKAMPNLGREISFITSQELEDLYPGLDCKEKENAYLKEHKTAFIIGIGGKLKSGKPHDGRAPDYDDWDLNGDILFWDEILQQAIEISSMGIRVSPKSLDRQLTLADCDHRRELPFHKMLLNGELPLTIGGGIGQSRLCMLILGKAHVGEVQVSLWDEETVRSCGGAGINIL